MTAIRVVRAETPEEAKRLCAEAIARRLAEDPDPKFVLAGGSTPEGTYAILASDYRTAVDWKGVEFWFGDERCVGPEHPKSNFGMARRTLFDPLAIPPEHVHRMLGELGADAAAERYESRLLGVTGFSVALLGMGPEGHTASLFPGAPALTSDRLCTSVLVPTPPPKRVTMTPRALALAGSVFFLVTGTEKAEALAAALTAQEGTGAAPTSFVRGRSETVVFCDRAALRSDS